MADKDKAEKVAVLTARLEFLEKKQLEHKLRMAEITEREAVLMAKLEVIHQRELETEARRIANGLGKNSHLSFCVSICTHATSPIFPCISGVERSETIRGLSW
jgi:hypothetical protein